MNAAQPDQCLTNPLAYGSALLHDNWDTFKGMEDMPQSGAGSCLKLGILASVFRSAGRNTSAG